jgi:hypothetical protein
MKLRTPHFRITDILIALAASYLTLLITISVQHRSPLSVFGRALHDPVGMLAAGRLWMAWVLVAVVIWPLTARR